MRLLITSAYIALQERVTSVITFSADEHYSNIIRKYPDLAQRIPQHMIASYMSLKSETLCRVRKKLTNH